MKKIAYLLILTVMLFGIPLFYFMAINTDVSLKYETDINECISRISEINLCEQKKTFMRLMYACGIGFVGMLIFIPKIMKDKQTKK